MCKLCYFETELDELMDKHDFPLKHLIREALSEMKCKDDDEDEDEYEDEDEDEYDDEDEDEYIKGIINKIYYRNNK
jgi:hypothetical protein